MRPAEESAGAAAGGRASRSFPHRPPSTAAVTSCHVAARHPRAADLLPTAQSLTRQQPRGGHGFVPPSCRSLHTRAPRVHDRAVSSVLFVGAGRHQRRAIAQARERGLRVVAVDRNAAAPGLRLADVAEVVDFADIDAVGDVARRHAVNGALTVSADRAVPVVAAVTERLGLPTIGTDVAHRMTHKIAMRRTLAEEGIPQPPFAAVRSLAEGRAALETVGFPAVLKPVDSGGQRGLFRIETAGDLESHLHSALAESPGREAILEGFVEGTEMNGIVVVRNGVARTVTLSDRLRPSGAGFGVGWIHLYPASIHSDQLDLAERVAERSVAALGLRSGIAFPQLIASPDGGISVVEVAARIPGGQMADLVRHAVGVDLVEVALRFALGEPVLDEV